MRLHHIVYFVATLFSFNVYAQNVPVHAEGLAEELIQVSIDDGVQRGVLSRRKDTAPGSKLIVLLPGYPSVVRPEVSHGVMINSALNGNFLVRARRHLNDGQVMTLLVDCHSSIGDVCKPDYQASPDRYRHVKALIDATKLKTPSIREIYLYSTSAGSISSAFMAQFGPDDFSGVVHSAAIDPTAPKSYPQLMNFDYSSIKPPQMFVHHLEDPCPITSYSYIRIISEKFKIPLVSVAGGGDFSGNVCAAFTQHGFKNKEAAVMKHVLKTVKTGVWVSDSI